MVNNMSEVTAKITVTSTTPYFFRAMYDWIVDNNLTPYLMVDAKNPKVMVPAGFVNDDGLITLNVSANSVSDWDMDNELLSFNAKFGGAVHTLYIPIDAMMVLFAKEDYTLGVRFQDALTPTDVVDTEQPNKHKPTTLTLV